MIKEYCLLDKLDFKFSNDKINLGEIISLLSEFVSRHKKYKSTLLNLQKIQVEIDEITYFIDCYKSNKMNELSKYTENDKQLFLSRQLNILINENIKKFKDISEFTKSNRPKSKSTEYIKFVAALELFKRLHFLYKQCITNEFGREDVTKLLRSPDNNIILIGFLKKNLFTLPSLILMGACIFMFCYISIVVKLNNLNIGWVTNYIDVGFLALKAKLIISSIIIAIFIIKLSISTPVSQILIDEESIGNQKIFCITTLININLILGFITLYNSPFMDEYLNCTYKAIILLGLLLLSFLIEFKFFRVSEALWTRVKSFVFMLFNQGLISLYAAIIFIVIAMIILIKFNNIGPYETPFYCAVVFSFYFILQNAAVNYKAPILIRYFLDLYIWIIFFAAGFIATTNESTILTICNAGYKSDTISLVKIQMGNTELEQELKNAGYNSINYATSENNDYGSALIEKINQPYFTQNVYDFNSPLLICKTLNKIPYFNFSNYPMSYDKFNYKHYENLWHSKIFIVQHESKNITNYWIYGVNIPFFLKNKILIIKLLPEVNKRQINLETEKGLKYFDIEDTYSFDGNNPKYIITLLENTLKNMYSIK